MKTVVITGASRGIGFATAKKFLEEGWFVIGTYFKTNVSLEHKNLVLIYYNQGDSRSIENTAREIEKLTNRVDVLINNAGILIDGDDSVADPVQVRKTFEVNVVGVVDLTERLLPLFKKGGHIVNVSSGYGAFSFSVDEEFSAGYRISKAALNMYTNHLAFRLKPRGILVSAIRPGWIKTDMGYSIATETSVPTIEPEEVANDIFTLATTVTETGQFWYNGKKNEW